MRLSSAALAAGCVLAMTACKKQQSEGKSAPDKRPASNVVLPKDQQHYLWIEQFPSCPSNGTNQFAHHLKIKVDEGDRVTYGYFVRAPVKWYDGLNLIVQKRPGKVEITFGQCNLRSDDPKMRCDDEDPNAVTWYAKETVMVDLAKHQVVPFHAPPKLACLQGESEVISIVAPRPDGSAGGGSAGSN